MYDGCKFGVEVVEIIIYDFEVYKFDWLICWLDTKTRKMYSIVNDKHAFEKFYEYYKNRIWVGYNSKHYDQWIAKGILAGFNPYLINHWIIKQKRRGYEFSKLLNRFPILDYDCSILGRSLKQLEAFMGHDIRETEVPFDIDRKLTEKEIQMTLKYCRHDVWETFQVFVETADSFETQMALLKEFNLPSYNISRTETQLAAIILDASPKKYNDEFDIRFADSIDLGQYEFIREKYMEWSTDICEYKDDLFTCDIMGVEHKLGFGGLHGAKKKYIATGNFLLLDVDSYYPSLMIIYDMLSRNVKYKGKFRKIRDKRFELKRAKDPKQKVYKLVINKVFGGSKDKYSALYDPQQSNNVCINGQLLLIDLIDKLEKKNLCTLTQSNTDGIMIEYELQNRAEIERVLQEWESRTGFHLSRDEITRVYQKDVNNYIVVFANGKIKRKGAWVKELSKLDYDLPIVNEAVVKYLLSGTDPWETVMNCNELIKFQKVTKIGANYEFAHHNGKRLTTKVNRVFASKDERDGTLYKKHVAKADDKLDKVGNTPDKCFIINENVLEMPVPDKLDKMWYLTLAKERIVEFGQGENL